MSTSLRVHCDFAWGTQLCLAYFVAPVTMTNADDALAAAERGGWTVRDGRDICPRHDRKLP